MGFVRFYKAPGLKAGQLKNKLHKILQIESSVIDLQTEFCYYVETEQPFEQEEIRILKWILAPPFEQECLRRYSVFNETKDNSVVEIGPRLNFSTAFSSNVVSICKSVKLKKVKRIERTIRYNIKCKKRFNKEMDNVIVNALADRMTECRYEKPIETFDHGFRPEKWFQIDIMGEGRKALEKVNTKLGLAFDDWDLDFYTELFLSKLKRNPTSVECFDLAQSNSEHSRHWFFKGRIILDGKEQQRSLIDMIVDTQNYSNANNVIKFSDNSSAINGFQIAVLRPTKTYESSNFHLQDIEQHLIFTAETHNFPTGVAPFSGATTGTGGRLRDIEGIGRGGNYIAGTAGYSVGNLHIPGYDLPWEEKNIDYPGNMASPLEIIIEASNGASDYGNKFGEPVICGFVRTYGATDNTGIRREWIKPIMFSGGLGTMDANLANKVPAKQGMRVVKIGGPIYRIGVGGGSASSVEVQGDNSSELDFGAVQRGDPEMEQKLNRMVRACVEMGDNNPILSIHDQGAGGNGNVLKELVEPAGAVIFTKCFDLGDPSISTLELWGAEYQESNAILCKPEDSDLLMKIAAREKCPINFVGTVIENGKIIVSEEEDCDASKYFNNEGRSVYLENNIEHPVNLELELILGKMPRKVFNLQKELPQRSPMRLPDGLTVSSALNRVLRLPSVASKRYLTNKVDRCVTGLVAQQQCVGPLHTPLADVAVTAISYFSVEGIASSIGEQPIKGLVNAAAGARMTVAEAVSNLVFARITSLQDVKCSGNWMWPAKLPGEGAALYEACTAMCSLMKELGIAIDGGKDSLSMAARIDQKIVKAPGTLVVSCYAPCPDIRCVITPDLKAPVTGRQGCLLFVDLSRGKSRLSGTALSQVYNELGDDVPDIEDVRALRNAFDATQQLIADEKILAGHDVSDGGLITCLLEMCFAGISGINVDISHRSAPAIDVLFSEEVGWVLEIDQIHYDEAIEVFQYHGISVYLIGKSVDFGMSSEIIIRVRNEIVLNTTVIDSMKIWEETSYQLERCQMNVDYALEEFNGLRERTVPAYCLSFNPIDRGFAVYRPISKCIKVAVIREEGINGDREMAASLLEAGFDVWDVTMQDLLKNHVTLEIFRGIIFPGGFSYADVCGSAKGWAASLLFHPSLREQLRQFVIRENTFSLGICNGCQLMSLLGWVGNVNTEETAMYLDHNLSERFECRWSTVKIENSPSIMLKGMEGSVLGIWIAHGEGRFTFYDKETLETLERNNCLPLRYTDDSGNPTSRYPENPNGSVNGIAAVCSKDGRHLAMMPHPERCTRMWQWPWKPAEWNFEVSPWQRLFDNAFIWCQKQD